MNKITSKYGTGEWADNRINWQIGCKHNCVYCYAAAMACGQYKRVIPGEWNKPTVNMKKVHQKYKKIKKTETNNGIIMIPTTHDIHREYIGEAITIFTRLLSVGNELLIVSKPDIVVWNNLFPVLRPYKNQIELRFTITTDDDTIREKYEPGAPSIDMRLQALKKAIKLGFKTSISCEPFLSNPIKTVKMLRKHGDFDVWVGPMSKTVPDELKYLYTKKYLLNRMSELDKLNVIYKDGYRKKTGWIPND
jgi:DNA repair photolyase